MVQKSQLRSDLVSLTIELNIEPIMQYQFTEIMRGIRAPIEAQEGCFKCKMGRDLDRSTTFYFNEKWDTLTSLRVHLGTKQFRKLLFALEMSSRQPLITIQDADGYHTLDSINHLFEYTGYAYDQDETGL